MKRALVIFLFIVAAVVATFIYFSPRSFTFSEVSPVYHAIPLDAPLFFEFRAARSMYVNQPVINDIREAGFWKGLYQNYQKIDSLITRTSEIPSWIRNEKVVVAIKNEGTSDLTPLFLVQAAGSSRKKGWIALFEKLFPKETYQTKERSYDHFTITDITDGQNRTHFSFSFAEGLLISSTKSALVEQALRQLQSSGIAGDPGFRPLGRTVSGNAEIVLFINHRFFPGFISRWLNGQVTRRTNEFGDNEAVRHSGAISAFRNFASWSQFDVGINQRGFQLRGRSTAFDSLNHYITVFAGQQPQRIQSDKNLPYNTSYFVSYLFSDKNDFFDRLENYFRANHVYYNREEKFTRMASETRINVKRLFTNILDNEIIVAGIGGVRNLSVGSGLIIMPVRNVPDAETQIIQLIGNYYTRRNQNLSDQTKSIDTGKRWNIYRFPYPSLPGIWLGHPFRAVKANFVGFGNQMVVFASSEDELTDYFNKMDKNETLSKNTAYQRFMDNSGNRANINVFVDIPQNEEMMRDIFHASQAKTIRQNKALIQNSTFINWQVINAKDMVLNNLLIGYTRADTKPGGRNQ